MKKYISLLFISLSLGVFAQQQEQFSQYMQNNFLVNPAEGGTDDFIDIKLGYRTQWVDFDPTDGSPRTFYLSGHAPVGKHETGEDTTGALPSLAFHGVGGAIISDQIGQFNITSVKASYAYHLPVSRSLILSLGAFAGIKQYSVDGEFDFDPDDDIDPLAASFRTTMVPDISLGIWGYSKNYYFGIASFQLLANGIDIYEDPTGNTQDANSELRAHHWATAGYKIHISEPIFIVPSFVIKYVQNAPVTFDLNAKVRYEDKYWVGISYRREDALVALAGVTLKKIIDLSYSFDITRTNIQNFSNGTHEFTLGLRLPNHQHHPPPAQFW